ncbi:MAG: hypothetical protein DDT29_01477 [Dehalococcoidia bacterium]|nr:hypothetical protein [Bacillota bacterium]
MNRITAREKVVNDGEVETQFTGKNLTSVGGIKLFHKFARKLGVEKALERSIKLPRKEVKYKTGRVLISLLYALVLDLNRLSDTARLQVDRDRISGYRGWNCSGGIPLPGT